MPPRTTAHDLPIDGFDASLWRALDGRRMEQPWQSMPDHVRRSSAGRPWQGLAVWHQVGPLGDLYVPSQGNHAILLRNGPPTRLLQRHGNQVGQTHWQRGDAVVLPTDTPSFWRSTTARDNIHIDLSPAWLQRAAGTDVVLGNCFGRSDPVLAAFAELLLASLDNGASLNPAFGEHIAMGIAIHLVERYAQPHSLPRGQGSLSMRQLRQVTEAVQGSLHERWPVARMAALAALSPFHFARAFKASAGTTPHAWVQLQRMELAARLVRGSRLPLEEIALQTGHPSAAHFSHAFRRHWGLAPSAFRRTG